mgnify:CR=1 FL=1
MFNHIAYETNFSNIDNCHLLHGFMQYGGECGQRQAYLCKCTSSQGRILYRQVHQPLQPCSWHQQEQVDARMDSLWQHFFTPGDFSRFAQADQSTVYYEVNDSMAFVYDVGSDDVRTEGMSYGMMICLQLDKPKQFDRLWRWAKTYMRYPDSSPWSGYFCWQCKADGTPFGHSNASDGEVYFATALFMAAHRWNNPQYEMMRWIFSTKQ